MIKQPDLKDIKERDVDLEVIAIKPQLEEYTFDPLKKDKNQETVYEYSAKNDNKPLSFLFKTKQISFIQRQNDFSLYGHYTKKTLLHHACNAIRMNSSFKNCDLTAINPNKTDTSVNTTRFLIVSQLFNCSKLCKKLPFLESTPFFAPILSATYLNDIDIINKKLGKKRINEQASLSILCTNGKIYWNLLELKDKSHHRTIITIPQELCVPHKHFPFIISIDSEFVDKNKDNCNIFENNRTNIPLAVGVKINYFNDLHATHYKTYIFDIKYYNLLKTNATNDFFKNSLEHIEYKPKNEYSKDNYNQEYYIINDDNILKRIIENEILSKTLRRKITNGRLYYINSFYKFERNRNIMISSIPVLFYFSLKDIKYFFGNEIYEHIEPLIHTGRKSGFNRYQTLSPFSFVYENNDIKMIFRIKLVDLFGLNSRGLLALSSSVNVKMNEKEALNEYKTDMRVAIEKKPNIFLNYLYEDTSSLLPILTNFNDYIKGLYDLFEIPYFTNIFCDSTDNELKLTLGALVACLFENYIYNIDFQLKSTLFKLGIIIKREELGYKKISVIEGLEMGSCKYLNYLKGSAIEGAFVAGGRCSNETPEETFFEYGGDIDFTSCYGTSINQLLYPIGVPHVLRNENGGFVCNLKTFLNKYRKELCEGCWYAVVSTKEGDDLSFDTDLFVSKLVSSKSIIQKMNNPSGMSQNMHLSGDQVILRRQVKHSIIVHETLEMIKRIGSNKEKRELYTKLYIITAVFYPKRYQCKDVKEFNWKVNNYYIEQAKKRSKDSIDYSRKNDKPYFWVGIPMSNFVGALVRKRKEYKNLAIKTGNKEYDSLQNFYKTIINTVYGVMASTFFKVSNLCCANNITGKARASVWFLSKSFNLKNTLTDGGILEIKKIFMPWCKNNKKPGFQQLYSIHISKKEEDLKYFKPFGYDKKNDTSPDWNSRFERFKKNPDTQLIKDTIENLDLMANDHFKKMYDFYKIKSCIIFSLEFKPENLFFRASTAQRAHYYLDTVGGSQVSKVRGTQKGKDEAIDSFIHEMLRYKAYADQNDQIIIRKFFYSQRNMLKKHDMPTFRQRFPNRFLDDDMSLHSSYISQKIFSISYDIGNYKDVKAYKNAKSRKTELLSYSFLNDNCIISIAPGCLILDSNKVWNLYLSNISYLNSCDEKFSRMSKIDKLKLKEFYDKIEVVDNNRFKKKTFIEMKPKKEAFKEISSYEATDDIDEELTLDCEQYPDKENYYDSDEDWSDIEILEV